MAIKTWMFFLWCYSASCIAQPVSMTMQDIIKQAKSEIYYRINQDYDDIEVQANGFENNKLVKTCEHELNYQLPDYHASSSRVVVNVSCDAPKWSIYLPMQIKIFQNVAVLNKALSKGHKLSLSDLELSKRDITNYSYGYFNDLAKVSGMELTGALKAGVVLRPKMLAAPTVIHKGDIVSINANAPGVSVSVHGIAQSNGALGDLIQVRNPKTKRVVEGLITSRGQIEVNVT